MNEIIKNKEKNEGDSLENTLRPLHLNDFIGQHEIKENLKVFIESAKLRQEKNNFISNYSSWNGRWL